MAEAHQALNLSARSFSASSAAATALRYSASRVALPEVEMPRGARATKYMGLSSTWIASKNGNTTRVMRPKHNEQVTFELKL